MGTRRTRRALLMMVAVLAGCASVMPAPSEIADDIGDIADGALRIQPQMIDAAKKLNVDLSASAIEKITASVQVLRDASKAIGHALTISASKPVVEKVAAAVMALVDVGASLALPGGVGITLTAMQTLLPLLFAAIKELMPASMRMRATAAPMSPEKARQILRFGALSMRGPSVILGDGVAGNAPVLAVQ